jgi:hypothetical protein
MWEELGWIEKKRADLYSKTGMKGLGENTTLDGDASIYFPSGYPELELKINQAAHQVGTIGRHIDGALKKLNMQRQYDRKP